MLYIVGTPIGNIDDLSLRAKRILEMVDIIACEDTRVTGLLLSEFKIANKLMSYHEHNRKSKEPHILRMLEEGKNVALVSDAGMPCISDPGVHLVRACNEKTIPLSVIPGPVAAISALALSGLDTERFVFEGFIPSEGSKRKVRLHQIAQSEITVVVYEAPHRLLKTLADLNELGMGDRQIVICREMTKRYEEIFRCRLREAADFFALKKPKGEFVLVIQGAIHSQDALSPQERKNVIIDLLSSGLSTKETSVKLSKDWQENRRDLYTEVIKVLESKNNQIREE